MPNKNYDWRYSFDNPLTLYILNDYTCEVFTMCLDMHKERPDLTLQYIMLRLRHHDISKWVSFYNKCYNDCITKYNKALKEKKQCLDDMQGIFMNVIVY